MTFGPGARLGPYEVTALLGEGGMGKVWRAHHTALRRDDALKVLPDAFASDPERLARFRREAQVLASLNHPNIAHVYGLEQWEGVPALVMELVEGETLADRIARGPIPVSDALPIARQIAEALEAAHEQGIIHRDLKPANIKLRPDGTVKVLDFGLAKAMEAPPSGHVPSLTNSPTITSPAMPFDFRSGHPEQGRGVMTGVGVLLGTAAYMSPEQARGKRVDQRCDLWAFGCVLYEMLAGQQAFAGENLADILGAVIHKEPDWARLPQGLPVTVAIYLRRCLQKDARQRVQAAGDIRLALEGAYDPPAVEIAGHERVRGGTAWGSRVRLGVVGATVLLVGLIAGTVISRVSTRAAPPTRFTVTFPDGAVTIGGAPRLALSADGRTLVYGGRGQLYRRNLDNFTEVAIDGSEGGTNPALSPDGRWVAFARAPGDLFRVPLEGGPASPIVRGLIRGFSWDDDSILFGANRAGLSRVASHGGDSQPVTTLRQGEIAHRWPDVLPGNRAAVFTVWRGSPATSQIAIASLVTGEHRVLFEGVYAKYSSTGHLIFIRNTSLWGIAFDLSRLETVGRAVPVVSDLPTTPDGAAQVALARDEGTLAYEPEFGNEARTLTWVDRQGRETPLATPPRRYALPRISPDGNRVAAQVEGDIWIWDTAREVLTRLTIDPNNDTYPVWTPDGRRLVFTSDRAGAANLFMQAADGSGDAERLTNGSNTEYGHSFTPDGRRLVFRDNVGGGGDIAALSMEPGRNRESVLASEFQERNADLSPDGRWIAYESNASGQFEVYVRPFPEANEGLVQVSVSGGLQPRWATAGKELFYLDLANRLMVASFEGSGSGARATAAIRPPTVVLDFEQAGYIIRGPGRDYDVSADGARVLVLKAPANRNEGGRVFVVQHWGEELKRLMPAN